MSYKTKHPTKKERQEAQLLRVAAGDSQYRLLVVQAIITAGGEELMASHGWTSEQATAWAQATIARARAYINPEAEESQHG